MNAQLRSTLLLEPRPSDADWAGVTLDGRGWRLGWLRGGRRIEVFGPPFAHISAAAAAARLVRESHGLEAPISSAGRGSSPPGALPGAGSPA